ncbi:MAG: helix-turn-helix domain-containing protein [Hyphomonadaceae bacterium]
MPIGEHIRRFREKAGRSQAWLGQKVGVGQTTVSSWESGRTEPSRSDTRKVAQALSVDISLLELGDEAAAADGPSNAQRFKNLYTHGFVRISAVAPVVAPANPAANAEAILKFWREADAERAAVLLTPELSLSGYAIDDLLLQEPLLDAVEAAIMQLRAESETLFPILVVGAPIRSRGSVFNCAVVIHRGKILGIVPKSYLPNYREFYEKRHFAVASDSTWLMTELGGHHIDFTAHQIFRARKLADFSFCVGHLRGPQTVPPSTLAAMASQHHSQSVGVEHCDRQSR